MKSHSYLTATALVAVVALAGCAGDSDNQPVPGTVESTNSKTSENNTPRTNPTPNPEPASNPPGPQSDIHTVGTAPQ